MDERLIKYIKENIERGFHVNKIRKAMLKAGYEFHAVEEHILHALHAPHETTKRETPKREAKKPQIKRKKFAFKPKFLIKTISAILAVALLSALVFYFVSKEPVKEEIFLEETFDKSSLNILNEALIKSNQDLCDSIGNEQIRNQCKSSFEVNETEVDEDTSAFNKAIINKNASICSQIAQDSLKTECLDAVNPAQENKTQVCNQACLDSRMLNSALIKKNETVCYGIVDVSTKNQCLANFGIEVQVVVEEQLENNTQIENEAGNQTQNENWTNSTEA